MRLKPKLLVVLQNPWAKDRLEPQQWNPGRWRSAFLTSHTNRRLGSEVIPDNCFRVFYTNVDPRVAATRHDAPQPDIRHLRRRLKNVRPHIILVCGSAARRVFGNDMQEACNGVPVVEMQHPASHSLSKRETTKVRQALADYARRFYTIACLAEG